MHAALESPRGVPNFVELAEKGQLAGGREQTIYLREIASLLPSLVKLPGFTTAVEFLPGGKYHSGVVKGDVVPTFEFKGGWGWLDCSGPTHTHPTSSSGIGGR